MQPFSAFKVYRLRFGKLRKASVKHGQQIIACCVVPLGVLGGGGGLGGVLGVLGVLGGVLGVLGGGLGGVLGVLGVLGGGLGGVLGVLGVLAYSAAYWPCFSANATTWRNLSVITALSYVRDPSARRMNGSSFCRSLSPNRSLA